MRRLIIAFALAFLTVAANPGPGPVSFARAQGTLQTFPSSRLEIITTSGRHGFTVELAESDEQRAQGLMYRRALALDAGMLFVYPHDRVISMWMKNTYIPLDMVFVAADGRVVAVAERAVPHSLRPISSGTAARGVVELAAGTVARLGIKPGDRVVSEKLAWSR